MANSILTPGYDDEIAEVSETTEEVYLIRDNYLSEYETEAEKSVVRENLNIYPKDSVYTKDEVDINVNEFIAEKVTQLLDLDDPYGILPQVEEMITDMCKTDGSTPFTMPQEGVDPTSDMHLTTRKYVQSVIKEHLQADDPHGILSQVDTILQKYVTVDDVYTTSKTYSKSEVDAMFNGYVKNDGSVPFTNAQVGSDPTMDSHLATKRYVDKVMYKHLVDVDPHGFVTTLNNRLASYAKSSNVYTKTQTYSRTQIDTIIASYADAAVASAIADYYEELNDKIYDITSAGYVKQDATIPFKAPIAGVDATSSYHLTTLSQVEELIENAANTIYDTIGSVVWYTSGPTEATAGLLEEGTELPETMTLQQVCDAIFYGKTVTVQAPEYADLSTSTTVTVCIHGSTALLDYIEVLQNGTSIAILTVDNFGDSTCTEVETSLITEETEIVVNAYYTNDAVLTDSATIKVSYPVFIGLLSKWKNASDITMDYLKELESEDTEGKQNQFVVCGDNVTSLTFYYKFEDATLRHPFIVVPASYPELESLSTSSQYFSIDAFDIVSLPLYLDAADTYINYKIYVFRQALSNLDQEITYNFAS